MMTPFYRKALSLFTRTQEAQIAKGLAKYPNTFNPHDWTPEELLNHALEETVDTVHYLVGLKELLDAKDRKIEMLEYVLAEERKRFTKHFYNGKTPKKSPFEEQYDMNFNPHFDQDDQ